MQMASLWLLSPLQPVSWDRGAGQLRPLPQVAGAGGAEASFVTGNVSSSDEEHRKQAQTGCWRDIWTEE